MDREEDGEMTSGLEPHGAELQEIKMVFTKEEQHHTLDEHSLNDDDDEYKLRI